MGMTSQSRQLLPVNKHKQVMYKLQLHHGLPTQSAADLNSLLLHASQVVNSVASATCNIVLLIAGCDLADGSSQKGVV